jgi:hypothetical protein
MSSRSRGGKRFWLTYESPFIGLKNLTCGFFESKDFAKYFLLLEEF